MSYPGPSKPVRIRQWEPTSPVARKRFRLDSSNSASGAATVGGLEPLKDDAGSVELANLSFGVHGGGNLCPNTASLTPSMVVIPSDLEPGLAASLAALKTESHALRVARASKEQNDKSTGKTYMRHINCYVRWWEAYQDSQCEEMPSWTPIPAFPITASRAAMYLEYESSREKVNGHCSLYLASSH